MNLLDNSALIHHLSRVVFFDHNFSIATYACSIENKRELHMLVPLKVERELHQPEHKQSTIHICDENFALLFFTLAYLEYRIKKRPWVLAHLRSEVAWLESTTHHAIVLIFLLTII